MKQVYKVGKQITSIDDIKKLAPIGADGFGIWNDELYYSKGDMVYIKRTNQYEIANSILSSLLLDLSDIKKD